MGHPAEDLSRYEQDDPSKEVLDSLADKKIGKEEALKLMEEKGKVRALLDNAGDVFTDKDKAMWERRLEDAKDTDENGLKALADEITLVQDYVRDINKDENRKYFGIDKSKGVDTAQDYIDAFKDQPLEIKRQWHALLGKEIEGLKKLFNEAEALMDDKEFGKFTKLRRHEKHEKLDELRESTKKIEAYETILDHNEALFSKAELDELKSNFKDMTPGEQTAAAKNLYKEVIQPRQKLAEDFAAFPEAFRSQEGKFKKSDMAEKERMLDQMKQKLETDFQEKIFGANISLESKREALTYFTSASTQKRCEAFKTLDKQIADEEKLATEFDDLCNQLTKVNSKNSPHEESADKRKFNKSSYKEKEAQIGRLKERIQTCKEEKADTTALTVELKQMLKDKKDQKIISVKTIQRYMDEFKKLDYEAKKAFVKQGGFAKAMADRKEVLDEFNKLPADVKKKNGPKFYNTGLQGRRIQLRNLENEQAASTTESRRDNAQEVATEKPDAGLMKDLKIEAQTHDLEERYEEAIKSYEKLLILAKKLNTTDEFAAKRIIALRKKLDVPTVQTIGMQEGPTEHEINAALEHTMQKGHIKRERENKTITGKFIDTFKKSAKETGQDDARNRRRNLSGKEAKLQEDLVEHSDMVFDEEGKATEIHKLDTNIGIQNMKEEERFNLKEEVVKAENKAGSGKTVDTFQVKDDGKNVAEQRAKEEAKKEEKRVKTMIRKDAVADMEKAGHTIDKAQLKKIKNKVRHSDIDVKLERSR